MNTEKKLTNKNERETIAEILKQRIILLNSFTRLLNIYSNADYGSESKKCALEGLKSVNFGGANQ